MSISRPHEFVVLGGGISGIAFTRLLQLSGVDDVLVLEAEAEPGGLCRTRRIGDHVLDVGGGHFLCSKFPEVYDFVFSHLPRAAFNSFARVSTIRLGALEIDYPLEANLWQLPIDDQVEFLASVLQSGEARGLTPPADFEGWIRWRFGQRIADEHMLPYNRKIWSVEPAEMDTDWLHKLPRLDARDIIRATLSKTSGHGRMPSHETFLYPKAGGFQEIFDAILRPVADRIRCSESVHSVEPEGSHLVVNGKYRARHVINTVPWAFLAASPIFDAEARGHIGALRHSSLVVSLHEQDYHTRAHWTYVPSLAAAHHREFFIHNFAPHSSRRGIYKETNLHRWNAHPDALHEHRNPYAYPIPTRSWARSIRIVLEQAERAGVFGLGRWGQWQYFNSDVCIREAMTMADRFGHARWRNMLGTEVGTA